MYKYTSEEINEHRIVRNKHEEETDDLFITWINKHFPNTYIINRTDEWENYDYMCYNKIKQTYSKIEAKLRNLDETKYNKYREQGFCLSYDKMNTCDVVVYIIPYSNEILTIKTSKIKDLLNQNKIHIVQKLVNKYQYTKRKEKHDETLLIIPYSEWKVYNM